MNSSTSLSSFLFFCRSSVESRRKIIFPSPPIQGKGPCIISRLRHPSFYLLRLQTPSRAAASNFTHPRRLRTFVSSSTTLSFTSYLSHIRRRIVPWRTDCFSPFSIVLSSAWSCRCQHCHPKQPRPPPPSLTYTQQQPPPPVDLPVSSSASSDGCHPVVENCTTLLTRGAVVYFGMFHCLLISRTSTLSPSL